MRRKRNCEKKKDEQLDANSTFIRDAIRIHKNRYDYSCTQFSGWNKPIKVICIEHGEFQIDKAIQHIKGDSGCPICRGTSIDQAQAIHGKDHFDYSSHLFESITCKTHNITFSSSPSLHIGSGRGCSECVKKSIQSMVLIHTMMRKYGCNYDYSRVKYENANTPVALGCWKHGYFSHMTSSGHFCPHCTTKETQAWMDKCRRIHGDKYHYGLVQSESCVVCPKHGKWSSRYHELGVGCPLCISKPEAHMEQVLGFLAVPFEREFSFPDSKLRYDFRLENGDMIEVDGAQHFKPIFGEENLRAMIHNDAVKTEKCKEEGIRLLRVSETEMERFEEHVKNWKTKTDLITYKGDEYAGLEEMKRKNDMALEIIRLGERIEFDKACDLYTRTKKSKLV